MSEPLQYNHTVLRLVFEVLPHRIVHECARCVCKDWLSVATKCLQVIDRATIHIKPQEKGARIPDRCRRFNHAKVTRAEDPEQVALSIATTVPSCRNVTLGADNPALLDIARHLPDTITSLNLLLEPPPSSDELANAIGHMTSLTHLRLWAAPGMHQVPSNCRSVVLEVHNRSSPGHVCLRPYLLPALQELHVVQSGTTCLDDVQVGMEVQLTSLRLGRKLGLDDVHMLSQLRMLEAMLHVGGPRCSIEGLKRLTSLEKLTADVGIEYVYTRCINTKMSHHHSAADGTLTDLLSVLPLSLKHLDIHLVYSNMHPFTVAAPLMARLHSLAIATVCAWWVGGCAAGVKTTNTAQLQLLDIGNSKATQLVAPHSTNLLNAAMRYNRLRVLHVHVAHARDGGALARLLQHCSATLQSLHIAGCIKNKHMATMRLLGECGSLTQLCLQRSIDAARLHQVLASLPKGLTYLDLGDEHACEGCLTHLPNLQELHCAGVLSTMPWGQHAQLRVLGCAASQWPRGVQLPCLETLYIRADWCVPIRLGVVLWVCSACSGSQPPWCLWTGSCCVFSAGKHRDAVRRALVDAMGDDDAPEIDEIDEALATIAWVARRAHQCVGDPAWCHADSRHVSTHRGAWRTQPPAWRGAVGDAQCVEAPWSCAVQLRLSRPAARTL